MDLVAKLKEFDGRHVASLSSLTTAVRHTWQATSTAALAASIAYGSLMATDFLGFKHFGVIGGIGMVLCWISTFVVLPPLIVWSERRGTIDHRAEMRLEIAQQAIGPAPFATAQLLRPPPCALLLCRAPRSPYTPRPTHTPPTAANAPPLVLIARPRQVREPDHRHRADDSEQKRSPRTGSQTEQETEYKSAEHPCCNRCQTIDAKTKGAPRDKSERPAQDQ